MKKRESAGKKRQQDNTGAPDIDGSRLRSTFQQNFRSTESSSACSICPSTGPVIGLRKRRGVMRVRVEYLGMNAMIDSIVALFLIQLAGTWVPVRTLAFSESKVYQDASCVLRRVEEIGWLNITV